MVIRVFYKGKIQNKPTVSLRAMIISAATFKIEWQRACLVSFVRKPAESCKKKYFPLVY